MSLIKRIVASSGIFLAVGDSVCVWDGVFSENLITANGQRVAPRELRDKIVGFYVGARRCTACHRFAKTLVEFRNLHAAGFEVVFLSKDSCADEMSYYMKETQMPWPAVPFTSADNAALRERLGVGAIPRLVIVSPQGKLITGAGRADILKHGAGALGVWQEKMTVIPA